MVGAIRIITEVFLRDFCTQKKPQPRKLFWFFSPNIKKGRDMIEIEIYDRDRDIW